MNKVRINISFAYGGWSIVFEKEFLLPFVPFFGMELSETFGDHTNEISLYNNDFTKTSIEYNITENLFDIYIRNFWRYGVTDETVDDIIDIYQRTGWTREDSTDIEELKKIMKK
jgi:hypothetical protein